MQFQHPFFQRSYSASGCCEQFSNLCFASLFWCVFDNYKIQAVQNSSSTCVVSTPSLLTDSPWAILSWSPTRAEGQTIVHVEVLWRAHQGQNRWLSLTIKNSYIFLKHLTEQCCLGVALQDKSSALVYLLPTAMQQTSNWPLNVRVKPTFLFEPFDLLTCMFFTLPL